MLDWHATWTAKPGTKLRAFTPLIAHACKCRKPFLHLGHGAVPGYRNPAPCRIAIRSRASNRRGVLAVPRVRRMRIPVQGGNARACVYEGDRLPMTLAIPATADVVRIWRRDVRSGSPLRCLSIVKMSTMYHTILVKARVLFHSLSTPAVLAFVVVVVLICLTIHATIGIGLGNLTRDFPLKQTGTWETQLFSSGSTAPRANSTRAWLIARSSRTWGGGAASLADGRDQESASHSRLCP
jgi:hypothetical protein